MKSYNMMHLLNIIEYWKTKYSSDSTEIIFKNKALLTNVRFTAKSLNNIQRNNVGFELIPSTIESPGEVWANMDKRNYINFEHKFVVSTVRGIIDSISVGKINNYRDGVWLI